MITASLRRATAAGRQIYVQPTPKTLSHARNNLRAFCEEAATRPQPEGFIPIDSNAQVVGCLGWTEFKGSKINEHFIKAQVSDQQSKVDDETYAAIIYQFVAEEGIPDIETIASQADFFYLTGFMIERFNETNWVGKGVLIDFSDIISYHTGSMWWRPSYYAEQKAGFCRGSAERAVQKGLLGPRPKSIQEPRRLPVPYHRPTANHILNQNARPLLPPFTGHSLPEAEDIPTEYLPFKNGQPDVTKRPVDTEDGVDKKEGFGLQDREPESPGLPAVDPPPCLRSISSHPPPRFQKPSRARWQRHPPS